MPSAGQLRDRITVQRRGSTQDEYWNEQTVAWEDVFTVAANIAPARGHEEVLAQRLRVSALSRSPCADHRKRGPLIPAGA